MSTRAPLLVLVSFVALGVVLKVGRIWSIAIGAGDTALLSQLPLAVGKDLLFAAAAAALVWALQLRLPRATAVGAWGAALTLAFFAVGNAISYDLTQAPLTFQRLRGDEGADLGDLRLLQIGDWLPGVWVLSWAAGLALAAVILRTRLPERTGPILLVGVALVGGVLEIGRVVTGGPLLSRLSETPLGVLAVSIVDEINPPPPPPRPSSHLPRALPRDEAHRDRLWKSIETPTTTPTHPPRAPTRAAGHKKNAIVFLAETLSFKHSSFSGIKDTTPHLARRAKEGLLMTRAYAPYCLSIQAIYGVACSDGPVPDGTNIAGINPRIDCGAVSEVMERHDIDAGLFHAGNFGFYDKLAFLGRRGWDIEVDAQTLASDKFESNTWGIDDAAMVESLLGWLDSRNKDERFFALMIPISAHYPYQLWRGHEAKFPGRSKKQRYLSSVAYLDETIEKMLSGLQTRGLLDDTAVIIVGDHGESHGEQVHESTGNRMAYETHANVPMVVLAKDVVPPQLSDRVVQLKDVVPTALDLLGLPPDPRHRGQSVFAPEWQDRRVFLGARGGGNRMVGFVDNDTKFLIDISTYRAELYDLRKDPHELFNLAPRRAADVAGFADAALAWRDWQGQRLREAPSLGDEIDLHAGALRDASVTWSEGDAKLSAPASRASVLERARKKVQGRTRDCLVLNLPEDGALTLHAADAEWVTEISQLRIATVDGGALDGAKVTLRGVSDGTEREGTLSRRSKVKRVEVVRPRTSIDVTVSVEGKAPLLCLTLGETAWRNTKKRRVVDDLPFVNAQDVPEAPDTPTATDDDDDEDDDHAHAVQEQERNR